MSLGAVIFDLDGVVVNTVPIHFKAWKKMFAEYGHDLTMEEYQQKVDGIPRYDGARNVLTELSESELKQAADKKQKYFIQHIDEEGVPVHADAIRFIAALKKSKVPRAVISSSKNCEKILKKIELYNDLEAVITGNDITKGKPDPQIFEMAAGKLGFDPGACVVFEDAVLGVEAAKRGGFKCVGIDRYGKPDRLSKANKVISSFDEISVDDLKTL